MLFSNVIILFIKYFLLISHYIFILHKFILMPKQQHFKINSKITNIRKKKKRPHDLAHKRSIKEEDGTQACMIKLD